MNKILKALWYALETVYIYLYISVAVIAGFVVWIILSLLPKKEHEKFTFDGYDL